MQTIKCDRRFINQRGQSCYCDKSNQSFVMLFGVAEAPFCPQLFVEKFTHEVERNRDAPGQEEETNSVVHVENVENWIHPRSSHQFYDVNPSDVHDYEN